MQAKARLRMVARRQVLSPKRLHAPVRRAGNEQIQRGRAARERSEAVLDAPRTARAVLNACCSTAKDGGRGGFEGGRQERGSERGGEITQLNRP